MILKWSWRVRSMPPMPSTNACALVGGGMVRQPTADQLLHAPPAVTGRCWSGGAASGFRSTRRRGPPCPPGTSWPARSACCGRRDSSGRYWFCTSSTKWLRSRWRPGPVIFGGTGVKPQLVDEQLGRVEHAGGLGEEFVFGGAVSLKVWLVQGPGRLFDEEIGREPRVVEPLHDLLGHAAHRHRLVHLLAGAVEKVLVSAFERCPQTRSSRTFGGKKSSSQCCRVGINPDQKIERPPKFNCGCSPMKSSSFASSNRSAARTCAHPNFFATLWFRNRQRL